MKKLLIFFLTLVLLFGFVFPINSYAVNNFTIVAFVPSPPSVDSFASYLLDLNLSADFKTNDFISITFPSGFALPSVIPTDLVRLNGSNASKVEVNGRVVRVYPASTVPSGSEVILKIDRRAKIKNPSNPGNYNFTVGISSETGTQSVSVTITKGVSHLSVLVTPDITSTNAMYIISFYTSDNGGLSGANGDNITVIFPQETVFTKKSIPNSAITVNGYVISGLVLTENVLKILLPQSLNIPNNGFVSIQISESAGIKNPGDPGDYFMSVFTDKDPVVTNTMFTIKGTTVSDFYASVVPNTQNANSEIRLHFVTSGNGSLKKDKDEILIKFPEGFVLPQHPDFSSVSINSIKVKSGSISKNGLISLFVPLDIASNSSVNVLIQKSFGIKNPNQKGSYEFVLYTTKDVMPVSSNVQINPSHISAPLFTISVPQISASSGYRVIFFTGPGGALAQNVGKIYIVFPEEFSLPSAINPSDISINKQPVQKPITIQQNKIIITVPLNISGNSGVIIELSKKCGIRNPAISGVYTLTVYTSVEQLPVVSTGIYVNDFPISNAVVTPEKPDGKNGFYKTHPKITLSVISPYSDTQIYYYFDNSEKVLYNGTPVVVPDGIHKFHFYAKNKNGEIEERIHEIDFKVDTVSPFITITSPKSDQVNNSYTVLAGNTETGATITINGDYVPVDKNGNFSVVVSGNGSKTFKIVAVDPAGNSASKTIVLNFNTIPQNPPELDITSPQDGTTVYMADLVVSGKTDPGATVTVNGESADVDSNGSFTVSLSLQPGQNKILVVAEKNGAKSEKVIYVKYIKSIVMKLQIGNSNAIVNGVVVSLDAPPVIINNRTLVPLRFISESFGANVEWDPVLRIVDVSFNGTTIKLQINNKLASVNGKKVILDSPPQIINGRTMVPLRFIVESFSAHVEWDGGTQTITITYP